MWLTSQAYVLENAFVVFVARRNLKQGFRGKYYKNQLLISSNGNTDVSPANFPGHNLIGWMARLSYPVNKSPPQLLPSLQNKIIKTLVTIASITDEDHGAFTKVERVDGQQKWWWRRCRRGKPSSSTCTSISTPVSILHLHFILKSTV